MKTCSSKVSSQAGFQKVEGLNWRRSCLDSNRFTGSYEVVFGGLDSIGYPSTYEDIQERLSEPLNTIDGMIDVARSKATNIRTAASAAEQARLREFLCELDDIKQRYVEFKREVEDLATNPTTNLAIENLRLKGELDEQRRAMANQTNRDQSLLIEKQQAIDYLKRERVRDLEANAKLRIGLDDPQALRRRDQHELRDALAQRDDLDQENIQLKAELEVGKQFVDAEVQRIMPP